MRVVRSIHRVGSDEVGHNHQMRFSWGALARRSLVASFVCQLVISVSLASAQTVIARHVPAGSTVELVMDGRVVGSAKADTEGIATITATDNVTVPIDAGVWVDYWGDIHRLVLSRRGSQPAADVVCRRVEVAGLYYVQRITSVVVDVREAPTVRLRQGRVPDSWLRDPVPVVAGTQGEGQGAGQSPAAARPPLPPLTGLTVFGGIGRGLASDFEAQVCGNVSCANENATPYTGGLAWWITDFVAAEARYNYLGEHQANASPAGYGFTTTREGAVLAFTGRGGVRLGKVRPFGRAGLAYHTATVSTTQTVDGTAIVVDGVTQTIPGGTQVIQSRTSGWAPVYGGGAEIWLSQFFAIFGEMQRIELKGPDDRGADIEIDDAELNVQVGVTIRIP